MNRSERTNSLLQMTSYSSAMTTDQNISYTKGYSISISLIFFYLPNTGMTSLGCPNALATEPASRGQTSATNEAASTLMDSYTAYHAEKILLHVCVHLLVSTLEGCCRFPAKFPSGSLDLMLQRVLQYVKNHFVPKDDVLAT